MALVSEWEQVEQTLPADWADARVIITLEEPTKAERVAALLAPLQPLRSTDHSVSVRIARSGDGPSPASLLRALARLDTERLHGSISIDSVASAEPSTPAAEGRRESLPESWDTALAGLPGDWSDLLGEIELDSSDYLQPGSVHLAPINPRLVPNTLRLQFRSASRYGYGASAGMVRRCLERCDADGIRGRVEVLRALSDSHPVATQGPVWQIDGRMV
jgi:hypothetical protein